jgi:hypothetical protein
MATSYSNPGGQGDRSTTVAVLPNNPAIVLPGKLLDGSDSGTGCYFNGGATLSLTFAFNQGLAKSSVVDEITWIQSGIQSQGTWKIQGSNNLVAWTDISDGFTLGSSATQVIAVSIGGVTNVTSYQFYRLLQTAGVGSGLVWLYEIKFKIEVVSTGALPAVGNVANGVDRGDGVTGTRVDCPVAKALDSSGNYGNPATPLVGTNVLPAVGDVRAGTAVGVSPAVGTMAAGGGGTFKATF